MRSILVTAFLLCVGLTVVAAIGESCTADGVKGTCIDTSECNGIITAKKCPGASNIKCCTYPKCKVGSDDGLCKKSSSCTGKTTSGKCPGSADIKCCTNEDGVEDEEDEGKETPSEPKFKPYAKTYPGIDEYIPALAKQWCDKRPDDCSDVDAMTNWLRKELDETIQGGSYRMGKKYPGDLTIGRAWLIGMQEQMWFQSNNPGKKLGSDFAPPTGVTLGPNPEWVKGSDKSPPYAYVSDFLVKWAQTIPKYWDGPLQVGTYKNHGGGKFDGAGFSADLMIGALDEFGFYKRENAVEFCKAVHAACKEIKCDWRIIYNDFTVADEINRYYGYKHIVFGGSASWSDKKQRFTNLNWHGPLILHMHMDIAPKATGPSETTSMTPARIAQNTRSIPLPPKPPAPGTGTACKVGNIDATCMESKDCKGTTFSGLCPFSVKCCLPAGQYPACAVKAAPGVCKPSKECKGKTHSGFCKDMPSAWKCCTGESSLIEEDGNQELELPQAPDEDQSSAEQEEEESSDAAAAQESSEPAEDSANLPEASSEESQAMEQDTDASFEEESSSRVPNLFALQPMED